MYQANTNELYFCVNGISSIPSVGEPAVGPCPNGCFENIPTDDAYCIPDGCTPICNPGNSQCNVEVCADDYCSFEYDHTCDIDEVCTNGVCVLQNNPDPAPNISSVNCGSYQRGDITTCTIY